MLNTLQYIFNGYNTHFNSNVSHGHAGYAGHVVHQGHQVHGGEGDLFGHEVHGNIHRGEVELGLCVLDQNVEGHLVDDEDPLKYNTVMNTTKCQL